MTLEFAHAVVYVVDMDNMIDFYSKVLDFEVSDRGPVAGDESPEIVFLSTHPEHHHQLAFLGVRNEENAQLIFVDTPGVHQPKHALNRRMVDEAYGVMGSVDVAVHVIGRRCCSAPRYRPRLKCWRANT